jgi:hypothetical protein
VKVKILLKGHHEGYIDWAEFERNQKQRSANAYRRRDGAKSGRAAALFSSGSSSAVVVDAV